MASSLGESRKRVAAPSDLLAGLPPEGHHGTGDTEEEVLQRIIGEPRPCASRQAMHDGHPELDRDHVAEGEQVPLPWYAPRYQSSEQGDNAGAPLGSRREREGDECGGE